MKIIPSGKVEITSSLSIQEVRDNISQNICPYRDLVSRIRNKKNDKTFEGRILNNHFNLQLIINMNNSFLPQISGEIQSVADGTKITADLKVHKFVKVFLIFWLSGVSIAFFTFLFGALLNEMNPFTPLIPIIMLVFGVGIIHFGFNMEKDNSINALKRIIANEKIEYINYNKKNR